MIQLVHSLGHSLHALCCVLYWHCKHCVHEFETRSIQALNAVLTYSRVLMEINNILYCGFIRGPIDEVFTNSFSSIGPRKFQPHNFIVIFFCPQFSFTFSNLSFLQGDGNIKQSIKLNV